MKNEGFTLIEVLAVIVILAILALISSPMILNVIEKSRKSATEQSTLGYIDAVEKQIMINDTNNNSLKDGTYNVEDINVSYKGKGPSKGIITIQKGTVERANICINSYSVDYEEEKANLSSSNYCKENKVIMIDQEEKEIAIENNKAIINLTNSGATNVSCNNHATIEIENNQLIVTNILGEVTCKMNDTLEDTINNLDDSQNSIIMLKDEEIDNTFIIEEDKNLNLNLNGKTINTLGSGYFITLYGNLNILGENSKIVGSSNGILTYGESVLSINGGVYNYMNFNGNSKSYISNVEFRCAVDKNDCYTFRTYDNASVQMENIYTNTSGKSFSTNNNSNIIIKDSNLNCYSDNCVITNTTGITDIANTNINSYGYSVRTNNFGITNIKDCTLESTSTYGIRIDKINQLNIINSKVTALSNAVKFTESTSTGILNIYNSDLTSENYYSVVNYSDSAIVNIYSGSFISKKYKSVGNNGNGTININQTKDPIYIASLFEEPTTFVLSSIQNITGKIKISGSFADLCTDNKEDTKMGLCVYSIDTALYSTSNGKIDVNGGTYTALHSSLKSSENSTSTINLKNVYLNSLQNSIYLHGKNKVNICNSRFSNNNNDIYSEDASVVNYSLDTIFKDGTNTPIIYNPNGIISANYLETC